MRSISKQMKLGGRKGGRNKSGKRVSRLTSKKAEINAGKRNGRAKTRGGGKGIREEKEREIHENQYRTVSYYSALIRHPEGASPRARRLGKRERNPKRRGEG